MNPAITITFGDCAENHVGMQKLGTAQASGLTLEDLEAAKGRFEEEGYTCELLDLVSAGGVEALAPEPAHVLVVRGGVRAFADPDAMLAEQRGLPVDKKFYNRRTGAVNNKNARHNLCFADEAQEPDYEAGRGRVVAFGDIPATNAVREGLPKYFGDRARGLYAEGNYYYAPRVCGIGFHGDGERKIVIAARLGTPIPLHYQWYHHHKPEGERVRLALAHGDLYAMSAKAVGTDWRRSVIPTLRHAAGAAKYLTIDGKV